MVLIPVILIVLGLSALRGGTNLVLLLPTLLTLAGGAVVVAIANKDMRERRNRFVSVLPTNRLRRKMRSARRPERPSRSTGKTTSLSARGPGHRPGPRRLPD